MSSALQCHLTCHSSNLAKSKTRASARLLRLTVWAVPAIHFLLLNWYQPPVILILQCACEFYHISFFQHVYVPVMFDLDLVSE